MKSFRIQDISLILAGLISLPAHAEVIPGRREKVSGLELGTSITVELKNEDWVEGNCEGLSASEVAVETRAARAVIPKSSAWLKPSIHPCDQVRTRTPCRVLE